MTNNRYANIADRDAKRVSEEKLKLSFDHIDWDSEEFFFYGLDSQYYQKFFWCMSELQSTPERQIAQQTHPSLRLKQQFHQMEMQDMARRQHWTQQQQLQEMQRQTKALTDAEFEQWCRNFDADLDRMNRD